MLMHQIDMYGGRAIPVGYEWALGLGFGMNGRGVACGARTMCNARTYVGREYVATKQNTITYN